MLQRQGRFNLSGGRTPSGQAVSAAETLGLLLLFGMAEAVAESADRGVWDAVRNACSPRVRPRLFMSDGSPRPELRGLLQDTTRTWHLRHFFDVERYADDGRRIRSHAFVHTLRMQVGLTRADLDDGCPMLEQLGRRRGDDPSGGDARMALRALLNRNDPITCATGFSEMRAALARFKTALRRQLPAAASNLAEQLEGNAWAAGGRGGQPLLERLMDRIRGDLDRGGPGKRVDDALEARSGALVEDVRFDTVGTQAFILDLDQRVLSRSVDAEEATLRVVDQDGACLAQTFLFDGEPADGSTVVRVPTSRLTAGSVRVIVATTEDADFDTDTDTDTDAEAASGLGSAVLLEEEVELFVTDAEAHPSYYAISGSPLSGPAAAAADRRYVLYDEGAVLDPEPERWWRVGRRWRMTLTQGRLAPAWIRDTGGRVSVDQDVLNRADLPASCAWLVKTHIDLLPRSGYTSPIWQHAETPITIRVKLPAGVEVEQLRIDGGLVDPQRFRIGGVGEAETGNRSLYVALPKQPVDRPGNLRVSVSLRAGAGAEGGLEGGSATLNARLPVRVVGGALAGPEGSCSEPLGQDVLLPLGAPRVSEGRFWIEAGPAESRRGEPVVDGRIDADRTELLLFEGGTPRMRLNAAPGSRRAGPMSMPPLAGYGAPLWVGPALNAHGGDEAEFGRLCVAGAVVDQGCVVQAGLTGKRTVMLRLGGRFAANLPEGPGRHHELRVLDRRGCWHPARGLRAADVHGDPGVVWEAELPDAVLKGTDGSAASAEYVCLALMGRGRWLGGVFHREALPRVAPWMDGVNKPGPLLESARESIWISLRRCRFPALTRQHCRRLKAWAAASPAPLLRSLTEVETHRDADLDWEATEDGWGTVVRTLLEDWQPNAEQAEQIFDAFGGQDVDSIGRLIADLLRLQPLLAERLLDHALRGLRADAQMMFLMSLVMSQGLAEVSGLIHAAGKTAGYRAQVLTELQTGLAERVAHLPLVTADAGYVREVVDEAMRHAGAWSRFRRQRPADARAYELLMAFPEGRDFAWFRLIARRLIDLG